MIKLLLLSVPSVNPDTLRPVDQFAGDDFDIGTHDGTVIVASKKTGNEVSFPWSIVRACLRVPLPSRSASETGESGHGEKRQDCQPVQCPSGVGSPHPPPDAALPIDLGEERKPKAKALPKWGKRK